MGGGVGERWIGGGGGGREEGTYQAGARAGEAFTGQFAHARGDGVVRCRHTS